MLCLPTSAVARFPWLTPVRAASVAPGAAALVAVARWLRQRAPQGGGRQQARAHGEHAAEQAGVGDGLRGSMLVSDRDLLDGLALALLQGLAPASGL